MGRHRKAPTKSGDVRKREHIQDSQISEAVEDRLGLNDNVCMSCNARQDTSLDKCRKCGSTELRRKASEYRGKGSSSS